MTFRTPSRKRPATVMPLAALLMTFLVAMLAFAIDIGYISSVEAELQDAADAAALAGAQQLQSAFVAYYSPGQTQQQQIYTTATTDTSNSSSPIPTAQRYAAYNQAGGVYIQVPTSDIQFKYYNGTTFSAASYPNNFPNTVAVTTRRDNNANGPLSLFFANIFGISTTNLTATASATIYAGDVSGFQAIAGVDAQILPVALDMNVWTNYANSNWSSPYLSGSVTTGPNGLPQLQVYPTGTNTPGSFGLVDTGTPSNSTPAFESWIDNGSTPNDINYLNSNNLLPVSPSAPKAWKAGPGLKSALLSSFQSVMGEPVLIPLFQPVSPYPDYVAASGSGSNATYAIVGFISATITQATGNGSNMNISIQPAALVSPTAVITDAAPAGSQLSVFGTPQTTFVAAKLTQ
jgi:Flp pilus assembly protein TadG